MPLFNFDTAINAVTTAHDEHTRLNREIKSNKEALLTLRAEKSCVSIKLNQLNRLGGIEAFNTAVAAQLATTEELAALNTQKQDIQEQIDALPKITSSLAEREQLATQQDILERIESLANSLNGLQTHLNDIGFKKNIFGNRSNPFSPQNAYNAIDAIVKIENVLNQHHSNDISDALSQILSNSPVTRLRAAEGTYYRRLSLKDYSIDETVAEIEKENISQELRLAQAEKNVLTRAIQELKETILQHESDEERTLPQRRNALKQQKNETSDAYSRALTQQSSAEATITSFDKIPKKAESLTEEDIAAYREGLLHQIEEIESDIETKKTQLTNLNKESSEAQTALTDAVTALQNQYNQAALTLAAVSTCTVVALVLLEVLTLPVAAPVLAVSLAAVGLWHYNQTTDPEALSNISPTVP
ncbi:MAG: hypothetical protein P1U36_00100 [Legionellaceae bacterium]|nr:hypothetical protein [Legionellaceae bacterium]